MSSTGDPSGCTGYSWTYDAWGNRTAQTGTSGTNCNQASTGFSTKNQITSPTGYVYDANGNLTNDTVHTYTYNAENWLTQVDGGATASYIYSADGRRMQKSVGSTSLTYLYDLSGKVVAEDNGTSWGPGYVYMGNQLLALYSGGTTYFVHADHLGSSRVLTAMNKSVYDKPDYLPYGEQIAGDTATSHKFTGYPRDADTGLDYASARYYGSRLGRFLTPDPSGMGAADLTNPQSLNQYAYVGDDPVNATDPSGMDPCGDFVACGDGGFGGGIFGPPPTIPNWTGINLPGIGGYNPWNLPGAGSINQCDFVECGLTYDPSTDPSADPASGGANADPGKLFLKANSDCNAGIGREITYQLKSQDVSGNITDAKNYFVQEHVVVRQGTPLYNANTTEPPDASGNSGYTDSIGGTAFRDTTQTFSSWQQGGPSTPLFVRDVFGHDYGTNGIWMNNGQVFVNGTPTPEGQGACRFGN